MATALASLYSVVVAGAVGLSLASLVSNLSRRGGRGYGRHQYRYGRSIEDNSAAVERTMNLIREQDFSRCGMKLVCEMARLDGEDQMSAEDIDVLSLVGPSIVPGQGLLPGSALQEYKMARGLGEYGYDCDQAFPTCPFNSTELIQSVISYLP